MNTYNPFSLEGKTILVTGASSGIGRATAVECAKLGARVVLTGRNEERLAATLASLEGEGHEMRVCDLCDADAREALVSSLPELSGCANNAGIGSKLPLAFTSTDKLMEVLQTNLLAPIELTRLLVKKKKLRRGSAMVLTSSIGGVWTVDTGNTAYSVSKSAIDGFMRNAAYELAQKGIRVNSVNPGMVDTPINHHENVTEEEMDAYKSLYPLGRFGEARDVALAIVYLLSDASSWVTGTALKIDGGVTLK